MVFEYKCPSCSGGIEFDTAKQKMACPFCATEFDLETLKCFDEELKAEGTDETEWSSACDADWGSDADGVALFTCNSCAGELVADEQTASTSCPYCNNPVVLTGRLKGDLKPEFVIPFKLDREAAKAALERHYKGKKLLPACFTQNNHIDDLQGVYVPFWLFDADINGYARFRATRVRAWSDSRFAYTETSHFLVKRTGRMLFDRIPVDGSTKMNSAMMESIEPYDFGKAKKFSAAYLAGFAADRYNIDSETSKTRANERIKNSSTALLRGSVTGYSSVTPEAEHITINRGSCSYALYPVWLLSTRWNDKTYTFAMNAQSGKFVGDLPVDWRKFWLWFFCMFAAISVLCIAVGFLLMYM